MLGLDSINKLVHFLEDILTESDRDEKLDSHAIDFFLDGIDFARKAFKGDEVNYHFKSTFEDNRGQSFKAERVERPKKKDVQKKFTIYHVDDEIQIGAVVKGLLESFGYEVRTFSKGEDLISALKGLGKNSSVEVVISDYNMPEMSGLDVLRAVKDIDQDLPVVLLSAYLAEDVCIEAVDKGAYAFLEKPINEGIFYGTIANAVKSVRSARVIKSSIKLLKYQFSDLADFLEDSGKGHIKDTIINEMRTIICEMQDLRKSKKENQL